MTRCFFTKQNGAMLFIIMLLMMMLGSFTPVFAEEGTIGDNALTLGTNDAPFYSVTVKNRNLTINTVTFSGATVKSFNVTRGSDNIPEKIDVVFADTTDSNASIKMTYDATTNIWLSNNSELANNLTKNNWATDRRSNIDGYNLTLTNGRYNGNLYLYAYNSGVVHPITVNFTTDTSDEADADTVTGIEIPTPPGKTDYTVGEIFDSAGMVVKATMGDGTSQKIKGYTIEPDGPLTLSNKKVTITYGNCTKDVPIKVYPRTTIQKVEVLNGQLLTSYSKPYLAVPLKLHKNDYNAVIWHDEEMGKFNITVDKGAKLAIGEQKLSPSEDGDEQDVYTVKLNTKGELEVFPGEKTVITVENDKGDKKEYNFTCFSQIYSGMPNRVTEYLCAGSQFTNDPITLGPYGVNAVSTLRGVHFDSTLGGTYENGGDTLIGPASVGNFGSTLVYEYNEPIKDDPKNPYGVDFIVSGNSYNGTIGFSEPGQVWVSKDGEKWYALAGSIHYDKECDWDYEVTYYPNGSWKEKNGTEGTGATFPQQNMYPLYDWNSDSVVKDDQGNVTALKLSGIKIAAADGTNEYGNTLPVTTYFGYADNAHYGFDAQTSGIDNVSLNPYPLTGKRLEVFDIAWAVDEEGKPANLDEVKYVKVQTATFLNNEATGEKSTEVCAMRKVDPQKENVGVTAAPASITVDGKALDLKEGQYVYEDVKVYGNFAINVDAPEETNVYINGAYAHFVPFYEMPSHNDMVRIILQEGEKAPLIYYLKVTETDVAQKTTKITFDANGGLVGGTMNRGEMVNGAETKDYEFDEGMVGAEFPTPHWTKHTFLGWKQVNSPFYSDSYDSWMIEHPQIAFKAIWKEDSSDEPSIDSPKVNVTFRLIGSTRSTQGVDLSKGEEGYYGAKYQTWIATHDYTLPAGSTVIDLVKMATKTAGIELKNPEGNYITEIKAPESLGGYWLGQKTNGVNSGWMYTIDGKHGNLGVAQQGLADGNEIILHYVNDYIYEVSDWDELGGGGTPDDALVDRWLKAEDKNPEDISTDQPTVDKTDLNAAIEKAEALQAKDYTVDSWKALADALTDAKAVQSDKDATREEVDAATKALTEATNALVKATAPAKEMPFTDVQEEAWFYEGVKYAYEHELVYGVSADQFAPDEFLTRAQCVTILYRSVGEPEVKENAGFTDVKSDSFAKNAINWGTKVGVIQGRSETVFDPDAPISREELATVLHRFYVKPLTKTMALSDGEDLSEFKDAADISQYALEAMTWTAENGYIQGMPGKVLEPKGKATRAQFVTIMTRTGKDELKPAVIAE